MSEDNYNNYGKSIAKVLICGFIGYTLLGYLGLGIGTTTGVIWARQN